eukprot:CAMPEP_0113696524 /NCGR_PEP_ID=MMETSP0038_2-20120614/21548_1 /TAXON_ID=2898 /ORGANISM="Cryptomonas paramecium" /LENGTH=59 /DNA_ID=CAMNT_0000619277 /DNA_START=35 /DNA_END=214 /DNA_ORIENTATION=+ /assembly_acc=CAM_ASM_000170
MAPVLEILQNNASVLEYCNEGCNRSEVRTHGARLMKEIWCDDLRNFSVSQYSKRLSGST